MRIISEITGKEYKTVEECKTAENEALAAKKRAEEEKAVKARERKVRADEVTAAYQAVVEARKHYNELLNSFIKDYGSFHMTLNKNVPMEELFEQFFKKSW